LVGTGKAGGSYSPNDLIIKPPSILFQTLPLLLVGDLKKFLMIHWN
jgi:hypothetical protein